MSGEVLSLARLRRPALLAFDVNETLLSLEPLRQRFEEIFGAVPPLGEWFARLLHGSLIANALDQHRPFGEIGAEALVTLAIRRGVELSPEEARSALALMAELPPHPDVVPAVERLATAGIRMIALTNGGPLVAEAQITNAGLAEHVVPVISVDEVGRFKPDSAVYQHAARRTGVPFGEMALVAAHDWDCAGAIAAGAQAVLVQRPGVRWGLPSEPPEVVVGDLGELADLLGV
jgi:2-haloacid dehalogenase